MFLAWMKRTGMPSETEWMPCGTTWIKQGWERVVTVRQKDDDVVVYLKTRGDEAVEGIVVTLIEHNSEAVLVNIVGDLRPEKIAVIGERLNIEPLKKVGAALQVK